MDTPSRITDITLRAVARRYWCGHCGKRRPVNRGGNCVHCFRPLLDMEEVRYQEAKKVYRG
jgi:hypothetical protein